MFSGIYFLFSFFIATDLVALFINNLFKIMASALLPNYSTSVIHG